MRIKKKIPKPSSKRPPLFFIGYRGTAPAADELALWYEREYHAPLIIQPESGAPESWHVTQGPWSAHVVIPLPVSHTAEIMKSLAWEQELMGAIAPSIVPNREMPDTVLFCARLAKGLTLLAQGTTYDVITQAYLNPSDWQSRALTSFLVDDHITISHNEQAKPGQVWCHTLGMSKFGLDEIETFYGTGLPESAAKELLTESATELLRVAQSPKVGTAFRLPVQGRTIRVINHRTVAPTGRMLGFRELQG